MPDVPQLRGGKARIDPAAYERRPPCRLHSLWPLQHLTPGQSPLVILPLVGWLFSPQTCRPLVHSLIPSTDSHWKRPVGQVLGCTFEASPSLHTAPPRGWSHPAPGVPTAPQSPCLDDRLPQFLSLASPVTPAVAQSQMPVMRASSLLSSHPTFYRSHPGPENVSGIWPPLS